MCNVLLLLPLFCFALPVVGRTLYLRVVFRFIFSGVPG